jgi:hypothetical protein
MSALWIEYEDDDENDGAARWGDITDAQIDDILAYAQKVIGRPSDTVA